jgi:hypothetical protein
MRLFSRNFISSLILDVVLGIYNIVYLHPNLIQRPETRLCIEFRVNMPTVQTLEAIDCEIERLSKKIESIQRKAENFNTSDKPRNTPLMRPNYSGLPDIQNFEVPKGFERAPATHEVDPEKAGKLENAESELRSALLDLNKQDTLLLLRKIRSHQARNPLGKEFKAKDAPVQDPLCDRFLSQWTN